MMQQRSLLKRRVIAERLNGKRIGMEPTSGVKQREEDAESVEEPRAAEKRRHEVQLRDYVQNVQSFDKQEEKVQVISVFSADADLIATVSQAVELFGVGSER